jgi:hypothetical protein
MGNKQGKQKGITKEQRSIASENRNTATAAAKQKVQNAQNFVVGEYRQNMFTPNTTNQVIATNNENFAKMFSITETAKRQLEREGDPLTKADLVAIVIALNPVYQKHIDTLQKNTMKDLNALIRTIVYDPSRYISSFDDMSHSEGENVQNRYNVNYSVSPHNVTSDSMALRRVNGEEMEFTDDHSFTNSELVVRLPDKPIRKGSNNNNATIVSYSNHLDKRESLMTSKVVPYSQTMDMDSNTNAVTNYLDSVRREHQKTTIVVPYSSKIDKSGMNTTTTVVPYSNDPKKKDSSSAVVNIFNLR